MKLREFEGKELFAQYGIPISKGEVVTDGAELPRVALPLVLKAQVRSGDRRKAGGIVFAHAREEATEGLRNLLGREINGEIVHEVLVEEMVDAEDEYYVSFSYDTVTRGPVLALSSKGGSGITDAETLPLDITQGVSEPFLQESFKRAGIVLSDALQNSMRGVVQNLWRLFLNEYALLAEINPLFRTKDGRVVAGDAKVILDDEKVNPGERRFIDMNGDIAILASGGGASLLNIDALLRCGGHPANYTEYSGNPTADVVRELTKRVLGRGGLKGCWVIGGTANFTDIFETMRGFVDGVREITPKPAYPFVIRRDGPRQKEAFAMLREVADAEGYQFHLFGSEISMAQTAKIITDLTREHGNSR